MVTQEAVTQVVEVGTAAETEQTAPTTAKADEKQLPATGVRLCRRSQQDSGDSSSLRTDQKRKEDKILQRIRKSEDSIPFLFMISHQSPIRSISSTRLV